MTPKFSIVIPTYSNVEGLRKCLESIVRFTDLTDVECVVVANGAPEEAREITEFYRYYPIKLIWLPDACGYTEATNIGIKAIHPETEFVVLLNDDCILLEQQQDKWLDLLLEPFSDPRMAITGPVLHKCEAANREFLIFFCVMIRKAVLDEIGILDEIFSPGSGEDTDWCCRAIDAGWKMQQVPPQQGTLVPKGSCPDLPEWKKMKMWSNHFPLYHDGNQTFSKIPEIYEPAMQKNHAILQERYNGKVPDAKPNCPTCSNLIYDKICLPCTEQADGLTLSRAALIDGWFGQDEGAWLAKQVKGLPAGAKVLEVGSWHGRSSRFIADNLPEGGQVWCCDTWNGSSGEPDAHLTAAKREGDHAHSWWWCNLQEHIIAGRVVPVRMHSANAAETLTHLIDKGQMEKFDLIFIDGDHSAQGIQTDVEAWMPLLKEDGLLCGHDYYKENEGPWWVHVRQYIEDRFPNVEKSATSIWHVRPHVEVQRGHVYDCFLFSNEFDVLDIRLATLYDHVDRFVLVEGTKTHAGQPKPLYFDENRERYAKYLDKITHIVVDDWPTDTGNVYDDAWAKERWQRDAIMHGLRDCKDNDIVIIGDADEIAHPKAVDEYNIACGPMRMKQRMFYYYLNCENKEGWDWQKIVPYSSVKKLTPCGIRYPPAGGWPLIEHSVGWHFSFLGSTDAIVSKLQSYSHQEFNTPEITDRERIEKLVSEGQDIFGRDLKYEFVEIDESYPAVVKDNQTKLQVRGLIKRSTPYELAEQAIAQVDEWRNARQTVTASVSTKDRYHILPLCLSAIINQTHKPDKLKIYDDGEQIPLHEVAPFDGLLKLAMEKGIQWEVLKTPRNGQVNNHQHCLECAETELIWRVDDDNIPETDCLENLLAEMNEGVGAVAGLVHHPENVHPLPSTINGSMSDIAMGASIQWYSWNGGPREVDHLYSTFLLRVNAAREAGGYCQELSPVGHREETLLTHSIKRAGYKLLVTPRAKTWHLQAATGGIRSFPDDSLWAHDEEVFQRYLKTWNAVPPSKLILLDAGLGDHLLFKGLLPQIRKRNEEKHLTLAVCFPDVFSDQPDLTLISIADAKVLCNGNYDDHSLFSWCWKNEWKGSLADAMLAYWG